MKKFKKISITLASLCLMGTMLLLSGCGQTTDTPPTTENTEIPGNSVAVTASPGIVRTTVNTDPDFLDPHLSASADTETMMNNVFEGLLGVTPDGAFVPVLASDYSISEDGLTYTFTIKDNVSFHNDKIMTIEDVIYSYKRLAGLNGETALSSKFTNVTSIDQVDTRTLRFTLSTPASSFLSAMTEAVIPSDYTEQDTAPVGTGPFTFESYLPTQSVTLTAYPKYHNSDLKIGIETLEFVIMPESGTSLLALQSGELDIAQIDSINAGILSEDFQVISYPQNMTQVFALNNAIAPFDDVRVRQAFNYAIDKDLIIQGAVDGFGTKIYSHASPVAGFWTYDFNGQDPYPYDPQKAVELLAEAGFPDGFETTVRVPSNYPTHVDTAQIIADMLADVGITLNIELIEWGQWLEQVYTNREYETTIVALTGKPDPHDTYIRYTSDYGSNFYNYTNDAYDALIDEANITFDINDRADLYKQAQILLTEEAAAVYIMDPHLILGADKNLMGFTPYPYQFFDGSKLFYTAD